MQPQVAKMEQDGRADVPEGAESVRLEDVLTFLKIYAKAESPQLEDRTNISTLLTDDNEKGLTTRISQMQRIVKFLYGKDEFKRSGLRRLFEKDHIGGLVPSPDARELYSISRSCGTSTATSRARSKRNARTTRRRSCASGRHRPSASGYSRRSSSHRQRLFPDGVQLEVEIADSHDLISRLKARLLDVVIAYGTSNAKTETVDHRTDLAFRSFGLRLADGAPLLTDRPVVDTRPEEG